MQIEIVRVGHRPVRDYRVSTHVCLVARALGAQKVWIQGEHETTVQKTLDAINDQWGHALELGFAKSIRKKVLEMKKEGFLLVHLTMYGLPLQDLEAKIRSSEKIAVLIGSEKVPAEYYEIADHNAAVTNQPHSEIAALAVFLDRIQEGKELGRKFDGPREIVPTARGKNMRRRQ